MTHQPPPMGCRRCGIEQRGHGIQAGTGGSHTWEQPTQQQIKDRMLARRAERNQMSETRIRADILFEAVDLPKVEFDKLKARIGEIADEYKATVTINGRMYPGVERERVEEEADVACPATFREDPMPDTVYCGEKGPHSRHTAWEGTNYYAWLDGDEGAGSDPM